MVGGLAMGGGSHALGSGFGVGAAMSASMMAGSAVTMGGNAVGAAMKMGGAAVALGASGLMAAVSKGSQAVAVSHYRQANFANLKRRGIHDSKKSKPLCILGSGRQSVGRS